MADTSDEGGGARRADAYEAAYMRGRGPVLYRDKIAASWHFHAIMAAPLVIQLLAAIALGRFGQLLVALPVLAIVWVLFSVLRMSVTADELVIQYGLFGPTIPIERVIACDAVDYDWKEFGGWGIRRSRKTGTTAYNMMGDSGRAVRVTWRDAKGAEKRVLVACGDPEGVAAAVHLAMASKLAGAARRPGLRVKAPGTEIVADEFEEEEAEEAQAARDVAKR